MSFIDNLKSTLKSLIGKKTDKVVSESEVKMEAAPAPVVETPEVVEEVSPKVEAVIDQVNADMGNISTETTTTENN